MNVLDTQIDVTANRSLLFLQYRPYFVLLLLSAVLDALSTIYFMNKVGPHIESNLLVRQLSYSLGIIWGPVLGKILQIVAVWLITIFTPHIIKFVCATIVLINCYAFVVNMHV